MRPALIPPKFRSVPSVKSVVNRLGFLPFHQRFAPLMEFLWNIPEYPDIKSLLPRPS